MLTLYTIKYHYWISPICFAIEAIRTINNCAKITGIFWMDRCTSSTICSVFFRKECVYCPIRKMLFWHILNFIIVLAISVIVVDIADVAVVVGVTITLVFFYWHFLLCCHSSYHRRCLWSSCCYCCHCYCCCLYSCWCYWCCRCCGWFYLCSCLFVVNAVIVVVGRS